MEKKHYLISLIILFTASHLIFGYEYDLSNFTDMTLVLSLKRRGIQGKSYQIIPPDKAVKQVWHDLYCIESIQWAKHNPNLRYQGGLTLIDSMGRIPDANQSKFEDALLTEYAWSPMKIKIVSNALFDATKKQAQAIAGAVTTKLGEMVEAAAEIAGISLCKGREFMIVDTGKKNILTRQPELLAVGEEGQ